MNQPEYVVKREQVICRINHEAKLDTCRPLNLAWGELQSPQELIDAVNSLKRNTNDTIDMSRLAQCIQSFHTYNWANLQMPADANKTLNHLWSLIKTDRQTAKR